MENKTSKYFKYAIGEIVLVVIGILIALQINNWNQERITHQENQIILNNLNKEFSENLIELNSSIREITVLVESLEKLLVQLRIQDKSITETEFDQLLANTFTTPSWTPSSFVLVELKNSGGLTKLNNNKLKTILFKWEREFDKVNALKKGYDDYATLYIEYLTLFGSVRNLDALSASMKDLKKSTIAKNNLTMLKDPLFENRADNFYFLGMALKNRYIELKTLMTEIINASKTENP
ncbi:DUF6090 family protein [Polaribacter sp.]|uniref:DUF6090 family protein n=1 Tax=Polaribacter sp. TaxID=1920175 RepID=UPI0040476E60